MLPVKRVIASATCSCHEAARSSRCSRCRNVSMLRSKTGARPRSGGGGYVGCRSLPLPRTDMLNSCCRKLRNRPGVPPCSNQSPLSAIDDLDALAQAVGLKAARLHHQTGTRYEHDTGLDARLSYYENSWARHNPLHSPCLMQWKRGLSGAHGTLARKCGLLLHA